MRVKARVISALLRTAFMATVPSSPLWTSLKGSGRAYTRFGGYLKPTGNARAYAHAMEFDRLEALRVGQELKKIRKQRGLSLADVETLSAGRWKAVVVGSYERADRAITVGRLSSLMALYQAPIGALFPFTYSREKADQSNNEVSDLLQGPLTIEIARRKEIAVHSFALSQFITYAINARGDWNGHVITLRRNDLETIAICEGLSLNDFIEKLRVHRFLALWR